MGKLVVLEGLDGSGKATQSELLEGWLREHGKEVHRVRFPWYEDDSSVLVRMYLSGELGSNPDDVNSYAASVFYAADRYVSYKKYWEKDYNSDAVLLADRYATSNAVFQTAKLEQSEREAYLCWLEDLEYGKLGIPKPDLVVYLDMDPGISEKLLVNRYHGDQSKKDIHERDVDFQRRCRESAAFCAKKLGWKTVRCDDGLTPRTPEEIHRDVAALMEDIIDFYA